MVRCHVCAGPAHRRGQANALVWLGGVRLSADDLPGAAQLLQAALNAFRRIGSRGAEAWALNRYAAVISAAGDHAQAGDLYRDALRLARETHQLDDEALALEGIGECQLRRAGASAGPWQERASQGRDLKHPAQS